MTDPRTLADRLEGPDGLASDSRAMHVSVHDLRAAAALLRDLAAERDAAVAANQLWQSNVEGAIADTGNLPGDLTAWSAIRRLTDERDELRADLDRILDAIGDPDELLLWVHEHNSIKLRQTAKRIADAVDGPT
jgi:hypothetical protein